MPSDELDVGLVSTADVEPEGERASLDSLVGDMAGNEAYMYVEVLL